MLKVSHANLVFISGALWLVIGSFLLQLGLTLLFQPAQNTALPLLSSLGALIGVEEASVCIAALALYVGFLKGKMVLSKAAAKGVTRICSFPNPMPLSSIYSAKYYLLLACMIGLGMGVKFFGIPNDIRGLIDIAVGSALINGAVCYFRMGWNIRCTN